MSSYRGRFAPSPSGQLHLGSLAAALASFIDAKAHHGKWLIRIEDIDPPREESGASQAILNTLYAHGMESDEPVLYQSKRSSAYDEQLAKWHTLGLMYRCNCTRKRLARNRIDVNDHRVYDGYCKTKPPNSEEACALRLDMEKACALLHINLHEKFSLDEKISHYRSEAPAEWGDLIVHRKGGLYAYNLAMVHDDIYQNITHVVRGEDLLEMSLQQNFLRQLMGGKHAFHAHIPVVCDPNGNKLSKQNHATPIDNNTARENLLYCCKHLSLEINMALSSISDLLSQAIEAWNKKYCK